MTRQRTQPLAPVLLALAAIASCQAQNAADSEALQAPKADQLPSDSAPLADAAESQLVAFYVTGMLKAQSGAT